MKASSSVYSEKLSGIQSQLKSDQHLLIVSKNRSNEEVKAYYDLGHRHFGENKVQELKEKSESLKDICPDIKWHMIGHLQSNKINQLFEIRNLWAIHSVDDLELVQKLIKSSNKSQHELKIFLQFKTSHEESKSGFESYQELLSAAKFFGDTKVLKLFGLMTMGTLRTENFEAEARRCFHELNQLKLRLEEDLSTKLATSMGMSQDYQVALEAHSNWIRLGTMMFS